MIDIELYEDEILDEELEDIIEEDEVIEDEIDDSHDSTENREILETKYDTYNEAYDEIVILLKNIIEKGELTQEDKDNMDLMNDRYNDSYIELNKEINIAKQIIDDNKWEELKSNMISNSQEDVFNALTNNGDVQGLFLDDDGNIFLNAQFLQTRGLTVVNDENKVTLSIDEEGNLTTSGDIVGGTITGAIMNAMTINTNTVNITSEDGGMTLEGALQKFSDERGNVRILIGRDTDGLFKFVLYGEDGSTVLIDKNGIKSDALSAETIKANHIASNSIKTKHLQAEVLETVDAHIQNLTADKATIEDLNATNATIRDLKAENVTITGKLDAVKAEIGTLDANIVNVSGELTATKAQIGELKADKADIIELNAIKGNITQLESEVAKIGTLESDVADIEHILAGNITADNIQTGTITAGSGIIADGAIGSAQISDLDAGKISAGKIDTSKVEVAGTDGHLRIKGNRLQVFNGTGSNAKERVSLGDVNGNGTVYGLRVRGVDGTTILLDENGVKSEGITDGAITNEKISDNADIDGAKLNINSVVTKINEDGTEVIKGTKIEVDGTSLTTKLSTITNKQNQDGERITQNTASIKANENAIKLKVDEQTYTTDKQNINSQLEKHTSEIGVMKDEINLKVEQTDINKAVDSVREGFAEDINALNKRIDDVLEDVGGAVVEGALDEAKCNIIENTIFQLNKEKAQLLARFEYVYSMSGLDSTIKTNLARAKDTYVNTVDRLIATINRIIADKHISPSEKTEYDTQVAEYSTSLTALVKVLEESLQNITNSKINTAKAEIKVTTDAISQNVSSLSQTVSTKADGSTVTAINNKVGSLETNISGISGKVTNLEKTTTTLGGQVTNAQETAESAVSKADKAQTTANTANSTADTNKGNITNLQGEVSTIKSDVAELEVTTSGITQKVSNVESTTATLTTKVNTAQNTANSAQSSANTANTNATNALNKANDANTLADSKAKVFTSTPTVPYKVGDLWVQGTSGDVMKCKTARATGSYTASDWEKASKYTDDTKANAVDGKVTTLQGEYNTTKSKVATLETNLDGITQRVSSTESTTATLTTKVEDAQDTADVANSQAQTNKTEIANTNTKVSSIETNLNSITSRVSNVETKQTSVDGKVTNLETWKKEAEQKITDTAIISTVKSSKDSDGKNTFAQQSDITQLNDSWTAKFNDGYNQGVTTINKDGITVTASNVKSKTNMSANGFKITKTDTNEDVFKVNSDGTLSIKGSITVTGGSIPTSNLSGTISSSQLNSSITTDITNAKNNASSALSTANTASTNANNAISTANTAKSTAESAKTTATNAQSTANTANTNASNAVSTANTAKSTADAVNKTVTDNKSNWDNAFNRVQQWAYGAVGGSTTIHGGLIETGTITAKQMYLGDLTNYCNLREETASLYGFTYTSDNGGTWYKAKTLQRDTCISGNKKNDYSYYKCNGGESFRIKYQFKSSVKGSTSSGGTDSAYCGINIGCYGKKSDGSNFYQLCSGGTSNASLSIQTISSTITLPSDAVSFGIFLQMAGWGNWSGECYIRNVEVFKMSNGELVVDGSITADKIASNAIVAGKIASGAITADKISSSAITSDKIASNAITAGKIASNAITADKLSATAIDGKTITGSNLRGGTFFTAPNSNETDGYAFRIYSDGRVYSKNTIQVYGTADNGKFAQLKDGYVTATEYLQSPGLKTSNTVLTLACNDVAVNGTGENSGRIRYRKSGDYYYFDPHYNGTVRLGSSTYRWNVLYTSNAVNVSSDRNLKENIRYVDSDNINPCATLDDNISLSDMYNFIKDELGLATYNLISNENPKDTKLGFIAQDMIYTTDGEDSKIGQLIVNNVEDAVKENVTLSYDTGNYMSVIAGALKQAILKIENLEGEIEELKCK